MICSEILLWLVNASADARMNSTYRSRLLRPVAESANLLALSMSHADDKKP